MYCEGRTKPIFRGFFHLVGLLVLVPLWVNDILPHINEHHEQVAVTSLVVGSIICWGASALFHTITWSLKEEIRWQKFGKWDAHDNTSWLVILTKAWYIYRPCRHFPENCLYVYSLCVFGNRPWSSSVDGYRSIRFHCYDLDRSIRWSLSCALRAWGASHISWAVNHINIPLLLHYLRVFNGGGENYGRFGIDQLPHRNIHFRQEVFELLQVLFWVSRNIPPVHSLFKLDGVHAHVFVGVRFGNTLWISGTFLPFPWDAICDTRVGEHDILSQWCMQQLSTYVLVIVISMMCPLLSLVVHRQPLSHPRRLDHS